MNSKILFNDLFEEETSIIAGAATNAQCHSWYVYGVLGGCFGTGQYTCSLWLQNCSDPPRR